MILTQVFIILSFIRQCHFQGSSGLKVQITVDGLNYVAGFGLDLLYMEVLSTKLPNQENIRNLKIISFVKPAALITSIPGQGLAVQFSDAAIELKFDWHYKIGKGWLSISDSGTGNAKSSSISVKIGLVLGRDDAGKPTAHLTSCSASIGGLKYSAGNFFYDAILKLLTTVFGFNVPRLLEEKFCESLNKLAAASLTTQLATLNTSVRIDDDVRLGYALSDNILFDAGYVETTHEGLFYSTNFKYVADSNLSMILPVPSKMVNLAISENLLNSGGYILQRLGRLNKTEVINNPTVNELFGLPPGPLAIKLTTTAPPTVSIRPTGLKFRVSTAIQISAAAVELISAEVALMLDGDAYIDDGYIKGHIDSMNGTLGALRVYKSVNVPADLLQEILTGLLDKLKPVINKKGTEGFPLPQLNHVVFVNPTMQRNDGVLFVSTDFRYSP